MLFRQYSVYSCIDFIFACVRVNLEIWIALYHCRQTCLGLVIEYMARNSVTFRIGKFIAHSKRRTCTFSYEQVAFTKPCSVLIINVFISFALFKDIDFRIADMFGQHYIRLLNIPDDARIKVGIDSSASDRAGEIYLFHCQLFYRLRCPVPEETHYLLLVIAVVLLKET